MKLSTYSRTLPLGELSVREWCLLSTLAEQKCVEVFSGLSQALEAADRELAKLLAEIAVEEQAHLDSVSAFMNEMEWPTVWHVSKGALRRLAQTHFQSVFCAPWSAHPTRDEVIAFVRRVEQESAQFYRTLALLSSDAESRAFFSDLAEKEASHCRAMDETALSTEQ